VFVFLGPIPVSAAVVRGRLELDDWGARKTVDLAAETCRTVG
jgi:hypothetical protein